MNMIAVIGTENPGRIIMSALPDGAMLPHSQELDAQDLVFVSDAPTVDMLDGHTMMTLAQFVDVAGTGSRCILAQENPAQKRDWVTAVHAKELTITEMRHKSAYLAENIRAGKGGIYDAHCMIKPSTTVGDYCLAQVFSLIGFGCQIGDYVTIGVHANVRDHVIVEDDVHIHAGAIIMSGTREQPRHIGKGAIIGMGAVVTEDVAPGVTVAGNPAQPV